MTKYFVAGTLAFMGLLFVPIFLNPAQAQHGHQPGGHGTKTPAEEGPVRITMDELHRLGGVPKGWRFRLPEGDPSEGRKVYVKMECHRCHTVRGERFPDAGRGPEDVGFDMAGIGGHHPPEYFAESVIDPNRTIIIGKGYTAKDGTSIMPSYADILTVRELIDLVAYISSLKKGGHHVGHVHGPAQGEKKESGGEMKTIPGHEGHMRNK